MRIIDCTQGTPEWKAARAGKITASRVADMMAQGKGGAESAGRRNLRAQLVAERLTGEPEETGFQTQAMRDGIEKEPLARAAYEVAECVFTDTVGFVLHPTLDFMGASPDALVGYHLDGPDADSFKPFGLAQFKCPLVSTHLEYLTKQTIPGDYLKQMQAEMACTGAAWCDFVSFCDKLPAHLQLWIKRVHRDDAFIATIEAEAKALDAEVAAVIASLPTA